jgi:hypothetical protein
MPINLTLSKEEMLKLFPEAKEGDSFETSVEGTFKMENGQLVPYVESVEGQALAAPMGEEVATSNPIEEALEGAESAEPAMPAKAPVIDPKEKAKADLMGGLAKIREGQPKSKYA